MSNAVRIGGQALADGVLMRTSRAWAVARDDGTVQVGAVRTGRLRRVPVLRFLVGLASGMRLAVSRGMLGHGAGRAGGRARRRNRGFLVTLVGVEAVGIGFSLLVGHAARSLPATLVVTAVPWVLAFAVLRLATPGSLWRYHGAEHKAVAAHEAGIPMADVAAVLACPRVHDRCGTNLVFVAMLGALALVALPAAVQLPALLALLAVGAEGVSLAARRPRSPLSRALLVGGRALQRFVTTAEPTAAEQSVGCRALAACLEHHHRLEGTTPAAVASGAEVPAAA
ncbi:MAG TPA: DUF1385 domain-containing protein [Acidimicrobiales bacterium]|nr:DUF1385 domain-containing protein [Acidimicrobiales bacterium]